MRRQMSPLEPLQIPNLKNDVVVGDSEEEGENTVSDGSNIVKPDQPSYLQDKLHDSGTVDSETNVSTHDMSTSSPVRRSRTRSTFEGSSIGRLTNRGIEENENGFILEVTAQSSKVAGRAKRTKSAPVRRASTSKRARTATEPVEDEHQDSDFSLDEADLLRTSKPLGSATTDQHAIDTTVPTGLENLCTAPVRSRALGELNSQDMRKPTKRSNKVSSRSSSKGGTKRANEQGPSTRTSSPMELLPISSPPVDEASSLLPPQIDPQNAALRAQAEPVTKQAEINAKPVRGEFAQPVATCHCTSLIPTLNCRTKGLAGILTRKGIAGVRHPGLSKAAKVPRLHANLKPPPPPKAAIPKPREKKKKGDESYSDEEKPWWKTKHPEEWTDEDFERYRRVTERRERGLDSD
ncbi:BZ3500_MvSof-1268-A1-R1_Chr4-2g07217 [Microbotryum saponariae]|uniref:BZ3500_MvSof-1268-A1-R1_Chr4-2g07217 protein n=1 Tax=Microbotryum saponariae TaxID=289078 RepID=A0A2X0NGM7_9BASI|nr:BZ3500_MvSof-1268-A1-R1_Chr4-2g07217 [Microbotryum saponariae]SDA06882.1 BZ3501_MvSof-1269-A2-R1_Chr4-2g06928 [Microbotryum saponariae]